MESNGKRVTADGAVLPFEAGEINFGEPGTNGQHSFYQLLHQGRTVPCDFIGFAAAQTPRSVAGEAVSNHDELMSNFFAQPDALACGKSAADLAAEGVPEPLRPHKTFPGNRPSLSLLLPRLDAFSAGQLLAVYEHRTAVQGFVWGICSFDQWGVELGKVLAKAVRTQLAKSRCVGGGGGAVGMIVCVYVCVAPCVYVCVRAWLCICVRGPLACHRQSSRAGTSRLGCPLPRLRGSTPRRPR